MHARLMEEPRRGALLQSFGYAFLASSLIANPPPDPVPGKTSAIELVANKSIWTLGFIIIAVALFITATKLPRRLPTAHGIAGTIVLPYGIASLGASIQNGTGWTVAAFCFIVAAGHFRAMQHGSFTVVDR